jgi:pilus assembly protein CpaB
LTSKLIKSGEKTGKLSYAIPNGKRAITVQVDSVTGIAGFVQPGDFVDLMVTIMVPQTSGTDTKDKATSILLRQNLEVLAVGTKMAVGQDQVNNTYDSVTLAVSPNDITDINLAATQGKIRLALRPPTDRNTISTSPKTAENIVR